MDALITEYETSIGPLNGAKVVARAWTDPAYRQRLFDDATAAIRELGFSSTPGDEYIVVVKNTPTIHNVVVCTLCSCYPRPILGNSPEWYRTPNYRRRIVRWPRQVLGEFGLHLPEDVEVRVEDSNQKHRFMVLPVRPAGTEAWSEDQLTEIVTRDCLIGVALPKPGVTTNAVHAVQPAIRPAANY